MVDTDTFLTTLNVMIDDFCKTSLLVIGLNDRTKMLG